MTSIRGTRARSRTRFLLGFAILLGVLLGPSALDATGRWGLAHVPIVITSGPLVGAAALLVAAVTTVPLAHLYELGNRTVWAPAVLHTGIDSFKLVVLPAAATTFSLTLALASIAIPLLVLAVPAPRPRRVAAIG